MSQPVDQALATRLQGFGGVDRAEGYLIRPTRASQIPEIFELAQSSGRSVAFHGSGRSYGDLALGDDALLVNLGRLNRILDYDLEEGVIEVEGGATLEQLWRYTIEDGWWPPIVSGTMKTSVAGAISANIHGKNHFREGTFCDHVLEMEICTPTGTRVLTPRDEEFFGVCGGLGLFGAITRARIALKRIGSGDLMVWPVSCANLQDQFDTFKKFEGDSDYMVSWIDAFARGLGEGRGLFHAAKHVTEANGAQYSLRSEHQELPDTVAGFFPKSTAWKAMRWFNNRTGMKMVNWAKHSQAKSREDGRVRFQPIVQYQFLLDYVPNWELAYGKRGFRQLQIFVPEDRAYGVFREALRTQQRMKLESFLVVMKRHRSDLYWLSHGVDGYSLAMDFKVPSEKHRHKFEQMASAIIDSTLDAGGRFYLAKDNLLIPEQAERYLGRPTLENFNSLKQRFDPDGLISNNLAKRLRLLTQQPEPVED
ncbi:MAG: FAD-dependent oxidoreductase [Fimbriimonadaceae bacterium]